MNENYDKTIKYYNKAIDNTNPENFKMLRNIGYLYFNKNEYKKSLDYYTQSCTIT